MEEGLWALEGCPLLLQGTAAPALCHELPDLCSVTQFHWLLAMHWEVLKTYVLSFAVYGVLFFFLLYSLLIIMARFILSFFWKCLWISKTAKAAGEKAGESTKESILDQSTALDFSSASLPSSQCLPQLFPSVPLSSSCIHSPVLISDVQPFHSLPNCSLAHSLLNMKLTTMELCPCVPTFEG